MWSDNPRRGMTLVELMVTITIIGILIGLALPSFVKAKDKALETEVKVNMNTINLAIHQWSTDREGYYPSYLWGGNLPSWGFPGEGATSVRAPYSDWHALDPLIRRGYLTTYPRNPFIKDGRGLCATTQQDPRFGCSNANFPELQSSGTTMGNLLHDPNHPSSGWHDLDLSGGPVTMQSVGNYMVGDGDPNTQDWVPGQFLYRSFNSRQTAPFPSQLTGTNALIESEGVADVYFLAVWGSIRTVGLDWLCSPQYQTNDCMPPAGTAESGYGGAGIYADGLPNIVFRDDWDTDNDGNVNGNDCDGDGNVGGRLDCDLDEVTVRSMVDKVNYAPSRAGAGNPDGAFDGLLVYVASRGTEG